ncbi:uncharacterized protein TrAFT101_006099 [Trichoderma asperellum]|uniref:uncharacterized protein n=1 Tax=Trichoderma asperellum TaxID=101201 RepID=UPI00331A4943|nr:hypothetical protein TrAFT101_006099 [Trichoderma asperellum]
MPSVSHIRGGLANARREFARHVNAASLPNAIHKTDEEARSIHYGTETSMTCSDSSSIKTINHVEDDNSVTDDIIGECSSYSTATQNYSETTAKATANAEATASSTEDMNGAQEPSAQLSADGAQTAVQRLGKAARENPMLAAATVVTGAGVAVVAVPALITAPIMGIAGMAGFTQAGIAGASIASALQASIGNVAAGSIFATVQSAAAGGYGVAALAGTAQAVGGAVAGAGSIGTAWTWLRGKPKAEPSKQ